MSLTSEIGEQPRLFRYELFLRSCFFICILTGVFVAVEPSPYDITSIITMGIWFVGGFKVDRGLLPLFFLLFVFTFMGFAALIPYWEEKDPVLYQLQSLYLVTTALFFSIYFSQHTIPRMDSMLKAYTLGATFAALVGIFSYLDLFGLGFLMPYEGRAGGTFKDPNVFGSYLILAVNYVLYTMLIKRDRITIIDVATLGIVLVGIFLSFSRGSWGATIVSSVLVVGAAYVTSASFRQRRRVTMLTGIALFVIVASLLIVMTIPNLNEFVISRVKLTQDYDEGVTGRFGNQLRSIPMLLDRFWGFGPLRYRLIFDLEPHNSYIGGFANDGWIGGFAWIGTVLCTAFVGFRLMFAPSPVRPLAQIVWPALFVWFMQGFQIDIDHWRHLFLGIGAVWGLEVARRRSSVQAPVAENRPLVGAR